MLSLKNLLVAFLLVFFLGWILLILAASAKADDYIIVNFDHLGLGDLSSKSFEISAPMEIHIGAIGAGRRSEDALYAYGWILNDDTREPEWVMDYDNTDRVRRERELREADEDFSLKPGSYTAYYYGGNPYSFSGEFRIEDLGDFIAVISDAISDEDEYEFEDRLSFTISTTSKSFKTLSVPKSGNGRVVRRLAADEDGYYQSEGFTLDKPMSLSIYAIGEYSRGDKVFVDGAWIIDADTRERVWHMERWNTDPAGGASKNRMFNDAVSFSAGNYIMYCSTDDSHSPEDWNAAPPYDPDNWGVTVLVENASLAASVKPYTDDQASREILAITRVRDNEYESRYITVKKPVVLHIYAIGEYGYEDEFVDYGWIEELSTMDHVWDMDYRNTEHAGGASKNRMFEANIDFEPGDYAVYYVTDGSHSYNRWNSSPPFDQKSYGLSIYGVGSDFDMSSVEVTSQRQRDGNTLVAITAVGDDEEESQYFTIEKPTKVRIYAIGEGVNREMYDYGWIEDANSGRVVWEMRYRKTRHAGGAKKNRMVDTVVLLEKGEFEAFYITDGSHSFSDWNDSKPRDPIHWGVTITVAE
jgi:hypothetical protein